MQLKVNGNDIDITLETEKTVGDVLKSFEEEAAKNDATTVSIVLNGSKITPDQFDRILVEPILDSTVLELSVITKADVEFSLKKIAATMNAEQLKDIPVYLQSNKDKEAAEIIENFANSCDEFLHTANMTTLFPDLYDKITIDGNSLNDFMKDFLPILTDFENAMKENDTVTVGDLAEYEISPRIESICSVLSSLK